MKYKDLEEECKKFNNKQALIGSNEFEIETNGKDIILKQYNIPGHLASSKYVTVTIPDIVTYISSGAFKEITYGLKVVSKSGNIRGLRGMFAESGVMWLDLSEFNTSNVTDMGYMFEGCISLSSIDISNLDTHNVISMESMFCGCEVLRKLDLGSFNTSKVEDMSNMFSYCYSLKGLDISNFTGKSLLNVNSMFDSCASLKYVNLKNLDISSVIRNNRLKGSVTDYSEVVWGIFMECSSLEELYVNGNSISILEKYKDDMFIDTPGDIKVNSGDVEESV